MVNTDDFSVSDTGGAEKKDPRTLNMSRTYDVLVDYSKLQFEGRFALTRGCFKLIRVSFFSRIISQSLPFRASNHQFVYKKK